MALFGLALMWLISLASYSPADPVLFFTTGTGTPVNFGGRVGAFLAELSYQLLGYTAYLAPVVLVVTGWHYFWCRVPDAAYTKLVGATLLFGCVASFLSLAFGTLRVGNREILAGGYLGRVLASSLAEYLNKTGSIILILTVLFLSIVLSTQFSFGRLFGVLFQLVRDRSAAHARRDARAERGTPAREATPGGAQEASREDGRQGRRQDRRQRWRDPKVVRTPSSVDERRCRGFPAGASQGRARRSPP